LDILQNQVFFWFVFLLVFGYCFFCCFVYCFLGFTSQSGMLLVGPTHSQQDIVTLSHLLPPTLVFVPSPPTKDGMLRDDEDEFNAIVSLVDAIATESMFIE
jgi:hypothetical protein